MARAPIGQRIRKRRQELGRSQLAVAAAVGISSSYLNLIEHNKRAVGGALLHRIAEAIDLDRQALTGTEEARLIAELAEVAGDPAVAGSGLSPEDAHEIVAAAPGAARIILALYRAYREARLRSDLIRERLGEDSFLAEASHQILALITTIRSYSEILTDYGDLSDAERHGFLATLASESERLAANAGDMFDFLGGRGSRRPRPGPREEIEDFVSDHANHFPTIEAAADGFRSRHFGGEPPGRVALSALLRKRHNVAVVAWPERDIPAGGERFDAAAGVYAHADWLPRPSVRFAAARLLGQLEIDDVLSEVASAFAPSSEGVGQRLKRALANYFAAALLMPYNTFRACAAETRHDFAVLEARFDASFEQVCHRLATLRRPGAEGIPIHFLRTDVAGNISKRFSASGLRLPRYGGACPRWIVHHALAVPGRVVQQVAALPEGDAYLFIAKANAAEPGRRPARAVMIGAAVVHARRFVQADGLDLSAPGLAVPVGVTCRQCPREACGDRAFDRIAFPGSQREPNDRADNGR
jgi:predicted transcriptional regulator/transcriptional regulator with XRE-family HTH domain